MLQQLVELVHQYQTTVLEAASLFQKHKGIDPSKLMNWKQAGLPREGFIDPEHRIKYSFHGVGCWVDLPQGEVDWDFGHDGRLDGFDSWRLWRFAEERNGQFPLFRRKETLEEAFSQALAAGLIVAPFKHHQDDLFYLRDVVQ